MILNQRAFFLEFQDRFVVSDHRDPYKKPAFFSLLTKTTDIGANSVVKFVDVKTNIGRAYNPNTGIFTTPRNGLYEFQTNFVSRGGNWLELNLMKNNELVAKGHGAKDHGTSGSIRVLLELKNGDKVYLRNPRSYGGILAEKPSMFSGTML